FTSRRRHTRLVSDWSSDVCSSDLPAASGRVRLREQPLRDALAVVRALARRDRDLPPRVGVPDRQRASRRQRPDGRVPWRAPGGGTLSPRRGTGVPGVHDLSLARTRRPARRQRPRLSDRCRDRGLEAAGPGDAERADADRRERGDARAAGRAREPDPGGAQRGRRRGAPGAVARPERSPAGRVLMRELTYADAIAEAL